jgi:hypothetical protein
MSFQLIHIEKKYLVLCIIMPKINVVDFNSPEERTADDTEPVHEAEELTRLKASLASQPVDELTEIHNTIKSAPDIPRPSPKTKKPKKVKQESEEPQNPAVEGISPQEESKPSSEESEGPLAPPPDQAKEQSKQNIKVTELHKCPDCGKEMTKKSLRYSHAKNCPAQKPKPKAKTTPKPSKKPVTDDVESNVQYDIPEEVIEKVISQRMETAKNNRIQRKQENIKRLALHIA